MTAPLTDLDLPETVIFDDDREPATIRCSAAGPWGRSGVRVIGDRLILLAGVERAVIGLDQIERWSVTSQDALAVLKVSVGEQSWAVRLPVELGRMLPALLHRLMGEPSTRHGGSRTG